jgi:hypothetical protein
MISDRSPLNTVYYRRNVNNMGTECIEKHRKLYKLVNTIPEIHLPKSQPPPQALMPHGKVTTSRRPAASC